MKKKLLIIVIAIVSVFCLAFGLAGCNKQGSDSSGGGSSSVITKPDYDMSGVSFTNKTYVYDGTEKTLEISGTLPEGVSVSYTANTLTEVGELTVTATFAGDTERYNPIPDRTAKLTIIKATYDMSGVTFEDATYSYDGTEKTLEISGTLPDGVAVQYTTNKLTNAGSIKVTATFNGDKVNHNFIPEMKATLTINKINYDMSGVTFEDVTYSYDGTEKTLEISGTLPDGVSVQYTTNKATEICNLKVTASFTGDTTNHNAIPDKNAYLIILGDGKYHKVFFWTADNDKTLFVVKDGEAVTNPPAAPEKDGYTVVWDTDYSEIKTDLNIRPQYTAIQYGITYFSNDGTNDSDNPTSYTIETDTITLKNATKTGYDFDGWYSDEEFTNKIDYVVKGSTGNKVLYAKFTASTYTLTYQTNGGQLSQSSGTAVYNTPYTLPVPQKNGYNFIGWFSSVENDAVKYTDSNGQSIQNWTVAQNSIVYAKWEIIVYNVTYVLNDGVNNSENINTYTVEDSNFTLKAPAKEHYDFDGWKCNNSPITAIIVNEAKNLTITAAWTATQYSITYNLDGGTSTNPTYHTVESNTINLEVPVKNGYTFTGWTGSNGETAKLVVTIPAGNTENLSYTAHWEIITYNITYNVVGGEYSAELPTTFTVVDLPITLSITPVNANNNFCGWYDNEDYTGDEIINLTDVGDKVLYGVIEYGTLGLKYTLKDDRYYVSAYSGTSNSVIIPSTHLNCAVVGISKNAFSGCSSLTDIILPDSIIDIGSSAFSGCMALTSIVIPDSVTSIGTSAFSGCSSLQNITLPFVGGSKEGATGAATLFGYIFGSKSYSGSIEITQSYGTTYKDFVSYCMPTTLNSVTITDSNIPSRAFYNCRTLTNIVTGSGVTSIGYYAFYNCTSLKSIIISDSVTSISAAFCNCTSLTNIVIPDSVTSIGEGTFFGCSSLASMTIPFVGRDLTSFYSAKYPFGVIFGTENYTGGVATRQNYKDSKDNVKYDFYYIPSTLRYVTVNVSNLPYGAFYRCSMLTNITIGNAVTGIGDYAFYNCNSLISATMPNSIVSIGEYAFGGCSQLENFTIPSRIGVIGEWAFSGCKKFAKNIVLPDSVGKIGLGAFSGCELIESLSLPFVGERKLGSYDNYWQYPFGFIFGTDSYTNSSEISQSFYGSSLSSTINQTYYIPSNLKSVIIRGGSIPCGAFGNCKFDITLGNNVTNIEDGGFSNCKTANIVILDGVTSIGNKAFNGCKFIKNMTIPNSATSIGYEAFKYCSALTNITIPDSVTSMGEGLFSGCTSLESVTIPFVGANSNGTGNSSFGYLFGSKSTSDNLKNVPSTLKNVIITGGTKLSGYAFGDCASIENVFIPSTVTSIAPNPAPTFYMCTSLKTITVDAANEYYASQDGILYNKLKTEFIHIPYNLSGTVNIADGITCIGESEFHNRTAITSINVPDSVTSIGNGAFSGCSALISITLPFVGESLKTATDVYQYPFGFIFGTESYTGGKVTTQFYYGGNTSSTTNTNYYIPMSLNSVTITGGKILRGAFYGCSLLTNIAIPSNITSIEACAFYKCNSLTSLNIPDGVTSIGAQAFSDCKELTSLNIPDNVTRIESSAFYGCSKITSMTIPNGITYIGDSMFSGCSSLTDIIIPNDMTNLGNYTFSGCRLLANIQIPDGVKKIGEGMFQKCSSLKNITIPDGVKSIGDYAFSECASLTSIIIPDGVTSIGKYTFSSCHKLTNIIIPNNVTSIGIDAFSYCDSLESIQIPNRVTSIGNEAFYCCRALLSITIPNSVTSIGVRAFYGCSSLTSLTIGSGVTNIGNYAFYDCTSLSSTYYFGTVTQWYNITIGSDNTYLTPDIRYYYSENKPSTSGNYWHYDTDGITPVKWN